VFLQQFLVLLEGIAVNQLAMAEIAIPVAPGIRLGSLARRLAGLRTFNSLIT